MTPSNQFQKQNEVLAILGTRHTLTMKMSVEQVHLSVTTICTYDSAQKLPNLYNTSGKNHFHEMNGDVGMAQWK